MPTYEYACKTCGEHLEVVQSFKDPSLTECPACGGPLRKVFGSIGIAFKGSGFYKTDSRSSSSAARTPKSDGSTESGSGASPAESAGGSGPGGSSGSGGGSGEVAKGDGAKKGDKSPASGGGSAAPPSTSSAAAS